MMEQLCPKCQTPVSNELQCEACQLVFKNYKPSKLRLYLKKLKDSDEVATLPYFQEPKRIRLLAFPFTFIFAFATVKTNLINLFSYFSVWVHEFGHAMMCWVSGIKATPLSFGTSGMTFSSGEGRSIIVFICFAFLNMLMMKNAKRDKAPFLNFLLIPLLILSVIMFFLASNDKVQEMIVAAGFGGEIIISLFMIISFYFRFPGQTQWNYFLRWPIMFIGFFTLIKTTSGWLEVHRLNTLYPFGGNFSEESVLGIPGDLHILMHDFGWGLSKFKKIYTGFLILTWSLIISFYFLFISKKIKTDE
jgi:hypothetical protein